MRIITLLCSALIPLSITLAQSIDEEESVHLSEGSGNPSSDDEDIQGSAVPADTHYATRPILHERLTTIPAKSEEELTKSFTGAPTTLIKQQRITTYGSTMRPHPSEPSEESLLSSNTVLIGLGLVLLIIFIVIICIICCCRKKQGYQPTKRDSF